MSKAIALRDDYSAQELRQLARKSRDANQSRRLLALAGVAEGLSRNDAARIGDVGAQTLRDWVIAFNEQGPNGLIDVPQPGRPPKLSEAQKQELIEIINQGPDPAIEGVVRWRCVDLRRIIQERYHVDLEESSISRILKEIGLSHISARPRHPRQQQDPEAIEAFKKKSYPRSLLK